MWPWPTTLSSALPWTTGKINSNTQLSEIIRRDTIDSTREVDPLRKADDAIEIDSSNYNINEVTEIICNYIENILK